MKKILGNIEDFISGFFIMITIVVVIINVILRKGFNTGLYWYEEVATISFVWSVFVGASGCYRRNMHIGIDMIKDLFPAKVQQVINLVVHILLLAINGYISYLSIIFIQESRSKMTAVLGIPSSYVSSALLVGFGLMTLHTVLFIIKDIKDLTTKKQTIEEV